MSVSSVEMQTTRLSEAADLPDFEATKQRQRAVWSAGDYAAIGVTLQIVGESLCEAVDLRADENVLDVAAGNGNASLAAARRFARVTSTDYVADLLHKGQARAAAENLPIQYEVADAENLPFPDETFDVVLSTFGVMFTPNQERAAQELLRVTRPGGRIGLTNWTPDGFIGMLFRVISRHVPPPRGLLSPALWGTQPRVNALFAEQAADIACSECEYWFRYRNPEHWLDYFRNYYGPLLKAFETLSPDKQEELHADLADLLTQWNQGGATSLKIPGAYLQVVVTKA